MIKKQAEVHILKMKRMCVIRKMNEVTIIKRLLRPNLSAMFPINGVDPDATKYGIIKNSPAYSAVIPNLSCNNSFPLSKNGTNNASVNMQIIIKIQKVPESLAISLKLISSFASCSSGSSWCYGVANISGLRPKSGESQSSSLTDYLTEAESSD